VWNELADVIFRHGEHSPHFQGLREYQLTFRPQWRSKYLACPAGLALPVVLADVSSLISGAALRSRRK
jgi:phosphatidylglycerol lysyltransferase